MKYMKRSKIFKASNVTFDPIKEVALSYGWWVFVKRINGKLVFNDYGYSVSARKHQSKVRSLLRELGVEIDATIESPNGLQDLNSAVNYYGDMILRLQAEINKPATRKAKNQERLAKIGMIKEKLETLKELVA